MADFTLDELLAAAEAEAGRTGRLLILSRASNDAGDRRIAQLEAELAQVRDDHAAELELTETYLRAHIENLQRDRDAADRTDRVVAGRRVRTGRVSTESNGDDSDG